MDDNKSGLLQPVLFNKSGLLQPIKWEPECKILNIF